MPRRKGKLRQAEPPVPPLTLLLGRGAFADSHPAFADFSVTANGRPPYHRVSRQAMRIHYPGILMIPLMLALMAAIGILDRFWPVSLIATGLEELYLWATTKDVR